MWFWSSSYGFEQVTVLIWIFFTYRFESYILNVSEPYLMNVHGVYHPFEIELSGKL